MAYPPYPTGTIPSPPQVARGEHRADGDGGDRADKRRPRAAWRPHGAGFRSGSMNYTTVNVHRQGKDNDGICSGLGGIVRQMTSMPRDDAHR